MWSWGRIPILYFFPFLWGKSSVGEVGEPPGASVSSSKKNWDNKSCLTKILKILNNVIQPDTVKALKKY